MKNPATQCPKNLVSNMQFEIHRIAHGQWQRQKLALVMSVFALLFAGACNGEDDDTYSENCGGEILLGSNVEKQTGQLCEYFLEVRDQHHITVYVTGEDENFRPQVFLLDAEGRKMATGTIRSSGSTMKSGRLSGGIYTIRVVPNEGWKGDFLLVPIDVGTDPRIAAYDPRCEAGEIVAGMPATFELSGSYCEISYSGTEKDKVNVTASSEFDTRLKILFNGIVKKKGLNEIVDYQLPDTGSYTIRVEFKNGGDKGRSSFLSTESQTELHHWTEGTAGNFYFFFDRRRSLFTARDSAGRGLPSSCVISVTDERPFSIALRAIMSRG